MMSSSTWIYSLQIILISTGAISIAMAVKFSVPLIMAFALYDLPNIWTSLFSWLKPPYLYVIINCIIITIFASSRFQHRVEHNSESNQARPLISARTPPPSHLITASISVQPVAEINVVEPPPEVVVETEDNESEANIVELKPVVVNGIKTIEYDEAGEMEDDDEPLITRSAYTPEPQKTINSSDSQLELLLPAEEKPQLSSRCDHRKPMKSRTEGGKTLMTESPDTMDSIWKMITEGRRVAPTGRLKELDTWENLGRHNDANALDHESLAPHVVKSEIFGDLTDDDASSTSAPAGSWPPSQMKRKGQPWSSQDELNSRAEAFINKVNAKLRLEREESLNQHAEMINHGEH